MPATGGRALAPIPTCASGGTARNANDAPAPQTTGNERKIELQDVSCDTGGAEIELPTRHRVGKEAKSCGRSAE